MKTGDTQKLSASGSGENEDSSIRYYCKTEELFDVLDKRKDTVLFVIRENIIFISSFLNFCSFLSIMEAELRKKYCNVTRQVIDLLVTFVSTVN